MAGQNQEHNPVNSEVPLSSMCIAPREVCIGFQLRNVNKCDRIDVMDGKHRRGEGNQVPLYWYYTSHLFAMGEIII